jgi:hypothetical protein
VHIIEIFFDKDTKQPMLTLKTPCAPKQSFPTLHAFRPAVQYFLKLVPLALLEKHIFIGMIFFFHIPCTYVVS